MSAKPVKISFLADESDLSKGLNKAGGDLDDFAADAKQAGDKAESALAGVGDKADEIGGASSQAAGGLGDLGGALGLLPGPLGSVGAGMEAAAPAIMGVTGAADLLNLATTKFPALAKAQTIATNAMAQAQKALNLVMAGNPIALTILAITALVAIFVIAYKRSETFRAIVDKAFAGIKAAGKATFDFLTDKIRRAFDVMKTIFMNFTGPGLLIKHWDTIKTKTTAAFDTVRTTIGNKIDGVKDVFSGLRARVDAVVGSYSGDGGGVLGRLHGLVERIGNMPGAIKGKAAGMWDGIGDSFKGTINKMIGWWNNLKFSVDIPDKIPGLPDSFSITTPNIPYLAQGGIVTRATLAVVGEAGPEAVIPLNRLGALGGTQHIIVELRGQEIDQLARGRAIRADLDAYDGSGGRRVARTA